MNVKVVPQSFQFLLGKISESCSLRGSLMFSGNLGFRCRIGRPVRLVLDRKEDMISTGKRHPFLARCKVSAEYSTNVKLLET